MKSLSFYVLVPGFLFIALFSRSLQGQELIDKRSDKLDAYLQGALEKFEVPNVEVLLLSEKSITYSYAWGEGGGIQTPYYLGSVSKSLTAYGIMRLIDKKVLGLEESVNSILPEIDFSGSSKPLLLRHLLSHTSGISKQDGFRNLPSSQALANSKTSLKLHTIPGEQFEYSNLNYALLGLILEKKSGLSFENYMQAEVFGPLQMEQSHASSTPSPQEGLIQQYQYFFGKPFEKEQATFHPSVVPAGFIRSSAQDMARFIQSQMNGKNLLGDSVLSHTSLDNMQSTWDGSDFGYAMGWKKGQINGTAFLQHLGSTATSYSGIFLIPSDSLGIVFLSNSNSSSFSEEVLTGVLQIATGGEADPVSSKEKFIGWAIALWILGNIVYFLLKAREAFRGNFALKKSKKIQNLLIQIAALVGFVLLFPLIAGIPFGSFLQLRPDWGIAILISAGLSILLAVIRLIK